MTIPPSWSIEDAKELYGVRSWGRDYFGVSAKGEVTVRLHHDGNQIREVSLMDIIRGLGERRTKLPVILRFRQLLTEQIENLNHAFAAAIETTGYQGTYQGVYPIKVNHQQQVLEEITTFGRQFHYGLEAGSKAELVVALAYLTDPNAYLICNGYKDREFIDLALLGKKMGLRVILVLEMTGELDPILDRAERLGVEPELGIRARLAAKSCGHWADSAGDRSVFGLSVSQIMETVERLRERGRLDWLRMLHFHHGSQIPNIRALREAVVEAARIYVDLVREGAPMGVLDMGGGLAVDYDGSQSSGLSSCNYSIEEYCVDMVDLVKRVVDGASIAHPDLITESGRAIVAYYSVLVFNVLGSNITSVPHQLPPLSPEAPPILGDLYAVTEILDRNHVQECFNDAVFYREQLRSQFLHGNVSLPDRALGEEIFAYLMQKISKMAETLDHVPDDLRLIDDYSTDFYYGNFSVFQSLPDAWAIHQLFPVMPIHRLNERPMRKAVIADVTCDCDGRIDRFLGEHEIRHALPVHELREDERYHLAVFLVGAYQETLGDLHNLIGDTNIVTVALNVDGNYHIMSEVEGDSVGEVLTYVEYDPKDLTERFRHSAEQAVLAGKITPAERGQVVATFVEGLRGYTYFED